VQFHNLKSKASKLRDDLYSINEKLLTGNYIQQDFLNNTKTTIEEYNVLQNEFYHDMKKYFSDFPIGDFDEVEEFLEHSKKTILYQKSVEFLGKFLSVNIDNEDVYAQLQKCKNNVLNLLKNNDVERIIESAIPCELFIDLMDKEPHEITNEQEELIEEVFPKPMPRMLYSKQFFIGQKYNPSLEQESDEEITDYKDSEVEVETEEKPEKEEEKATKKEETKEEDLTIEKAETEKEAATEEKEEIEEIETIIEKKEEIGERQEIVEEKEKTSNYSYYTKKQEKQFSVSAFKKDILNFNRTSLLKLLYYTCLFRLLTESQIKEYVINESDNADTIINLLHKDGYLTEITNIITGEKSYCLSKRGIKIFERKDSKNEFIRSKKLFQIRIEIPNSLISDYNLRHNEDIINKYIISNDVKFYILEELKKLEFIKKPTIINKETTEDLPYSVLTIINEINKELNLLIFDESICKDISVEELSPMIESNSIDIIFCITQGSTDFGEHKTQILYNEKFYYVNYLSDEKIVTFTGIDNNEYDLNSILQVLKPEENESELEGDAASQFEEAAYGTDEESKDNEVKSESDQKTNEYNVKNQAEETSDATLDAKQQNLYTNDILSVVKLLNEGRLTESIVLAKALSLIPEKEVFKIFYERLLYAANMSIDNHEYSSNDIMALDNKEAEFNDYIPEDLHKVLWLSTFTWALLVPGVPHDINLYKYKDSVLAEAENLFESNAPSIESVYKILFELGDCSKTGFSNSVVTALKYEKQNRQANENLKGQANSLISYRMPKYKAIGVPELYKTCFGNESDLCRCMCIISESNIQNIDFVKGVFREFVEESRDATIISNEKIEDYIEDCWDNVILRKTIHRKMNKLPGEIEGNVFNNIKNRLEIISQWLIINDSNNNYGIDNYDKLKDLKNRLVLNITSACEEIEKDKYSKDEFLKAGLFVLQSSMSKIKHYLQDNKPYHYKWDYIEMLKSHYISLDNEYKPVLNKNFQSVTGFEPWRRVLAHINSDKKDYEEALKLITGSPKNEEWFKNYNSAVCIEEYLFEKNGRKTHDYSNAIKQARIDAEKEKEDLISELELAYAYGRIDESSKEDINREMMDFGDELVDIGDFASFRAFLNTLRDYVKNYSQNRKEELKQKIDLMQIKTGNADVSVVKAIQRNLEEENFTVAEEYINRIELGDTSLMDELRNESVSDAESDYHERFIHSYNSFFNLCRKNTQENVLVKWAERSIESKIRNFSPGQRNMSKKLLQSWPKGRDSRTLTSDVKSLLSNFGFTVTEIKTDNSIKKCELFNLSIVPRSKYLEDYPQPIARFGTQISEPVSVLCLFGRTYSSPNSLKEIFIDETLKLADCTFVLVDAAFPLIERRQIAELLKAEIHSMNTFIIIDRVLMLFLATLDSSKWLSALLKCTLPYTYCQPYVQGAGVIADEMFFGRKAELHSIRDYNGASLVYGGRQLGKTALLLRACSLMHNPKLKKFAYYIDITKLKAKQAFTKIYEVLSENKIVEEPCTNFERLCSALSNKLTSGQISELQIFIDEADDFFEDISYDDYEELKPFKRLRDRFPNRFKVVFAGLHKVAHSKNNTVVLQYGTPLCIKPFSPSDAKNLIERPLSYLGFRFKGDEGKKQLSLIMANSNYYPGLLHLFCYKLVESISENYKNYYNATKQNPPYIINEEHLKKLFLTAGLNDEIKKFFQGTLKLDDKYKLIGNIIAYLSYQDKSEGINRPEGFHIDEIKECEDLKITHDMGKDEFETLLQEMVEMGILWNKPGTKYYRLRRNSYLEMIGSEYDVLDVIISELERQQNERVL
jgi:hypothetical protein